MTNLITLRKACPACGRAGSVYLTLTREGHQIVCGGCVRCTYQVGRT